MAGGANAMRILAEASLLPRRATAAGDDGPPVVTPRGPAREAAERELSDPRYHQNDPGLLQRALDWIVDHVGALLSRAAGATPGGWTGIAVILLLVVLLLVALRLRLGRLREGEAARKERLFADGPRSAAAHRESAERLASDARWSEALQERMRALVRSLEERALLEPRPGHTADEAAEEAGRALPEHRTALRSAALAFDEVAYAGRPADEAAYGRMRDLDEELRRTRPAPTRTATSGQNVPDPGSGPALWTAPSGSIGSCGSTYGSDPGGRRAGTIVPPAPPHEGLRHPGDGDGSGPGGAGGPDRTGVPDHDGGAAQDAGSGRGDGARPDDETAPGHRGRADSDDGNGDGR